MCRRGVARAHVFRVTIAPAAASGSVPSILGSHEPEVDPPEGPDLRRVKVRAMSGVSAGFSRV